MNSSTAENFLKELAGKHAVRYDKKLFSMLETDKGYLAPDLHTLFDSWYDQKLKTSVYPQYRTVETMNQTVIKSAPKGSAYTELMEMIGLDEAKKIIRQALAYAKAQKVFFEKELHQTTCPCIWYFPGIRVRQRRLSPGSLPGS